MSGELRRLDGEEGLTWSESKRFKACEEKIGKAKVGFDKAKDRFADKAGAALQEIRDKRLYRAEYGSFEDYCVVKWGFSRRTGDRMIQVVVEQAALVEQKAITAGQGETRVSLSQREAAKRATARRRSEEAHDGATVDGERAGDAAPEPVAPTGPVSRPPTSRPTPSGGVPAPVARGGPEAGGTARPAARPAGPTPRNVAAGLVRAHEEADAGVVVEGITATELAFVKGYWTTVERAWNRRRGTAAPLDRREVVTHFKKP